MFSGYPSRVGELRRLGIPVRVSLEPLIPGLTDTRENIEPVLDSLAALGIAHVTVSYMFLRAGIVENLIRVLPEASVGENILEPYAGGPNLEGARLATARYLRKARRQRGYAALMTLAATRGMTMTVSGTTNPDFPSARPAPSTSGLFPTRIPLRTLYMQAFPG